MKSIGKALVAGIGIQVSFFLITLLLDVSTIAIYSIGAMPLRVLPNDNREHRIIQPVITMNNSWLDGSNNNKKKTTSDGKPKDFYTVNYKCDSASAWLEKNKNYDNTYLTPKPEKDKKPTKKPTKKERVFQQCLVHNNYLIARRPDCFYSKGKNDKCGQGNRKGDLTYDPVNYEYCVYNQNIFRIAENIYSNGGDLQFYYIPLDKNMTGTPSSFTGFRAGSGTFNTKFTKEDKRYARDFKPDSYKTDSERAKAYHDKMFDKDEKWVTTEDFCKTTFTEISKKANGMGGVLTTIFSSILRFSDITLFNNDNIGRVAISFFIRAILGIMLIAPLIVLAISLIKRVGYLWIAIIGSPFIILLKAFGDDLGIKLDNELEIFNLEKVIWLIFMPVITVFALSVGIVFLTTLENTINEDGFNDGSKVFKTMGIQEKKDSSPGVKCYSIFITDICYETDGQNGDGWGNFANYFSRTMMMLFGTGVMRMIVFASFKASSISKNLGESVNKLWQSVALSAPVIPMWWGKGIGLGALWVGTGHNGYLDQALSHYQNEIRGQASSLFKKKNNDSSSWSAKPVEITDQNIIKPLISGIQSSSTDPAKDIANWLNSNINSNSAKAVIAAMEKAKTQSATFTDNNKTYAIFYDKSKEKDKFTVEEQKKAETTK